jgi:hypothetical protein
MTLAAARRTVAFALLAAVLFLFYCYYLGVNAHLVAYLSDAGFGDAAAARSFGYTIAIGIAGKLGMGFVADRVGLRAATLWTFGALTLGSGLLLLLGVFPILRPVFLTLHGFTVAAGTPLPLIVVASFGSRHAGDLWSAHAGAVGRRRRSRWRRDPSMLGSTPAFAIFAGANLFAGVGVAWLGRRWNSAQFKH